MPRLDCRGSLVRRRDLARWPRAFAAEWAGLHFMIGAFLAGAVTEADWFAEKQHEQMRGSVLLFLMPVYFPCHGPAHRLGHRRCRRFSSSPRAAAGGRGPRQVAGSLVCRPYPSLAGRRGVIDRLDSPDQGLDHDRLHRRPARQANHSAGNIHGAADDGDREHDADRADVPPKLGEMGHFIDVYRRPLRMLMIDFPIKVKWMRRRAPIHRLATRVNAKC